MLLSPMPRPLEEGQAKMVGKQYMALRQQRGLLITDVAFLTGQEISVIMDIEQGSSLKKASFHDYIRYADALSSSLREMFDTHRHQELLVPLSEEQTLKQVEAAIQCQVPFCALPLKICPFFALPLKCFALRTV